MATDERKVRPVTTLSTAIHDRLGSRAEAGAWLLVIELFLGLGWARAAVEKVIDVDWWTGDAIQRFVAENEASALGWFAPFLSTVVVPLAVVVAAIVLALEGFVAASLLSGRRRGVGLAVGIGLNLTFLAAGAVNPSAFYLVLQGAAVIALVERTQRDLDRPLFGVELVVVTAAAMSAPSIRTLHPAQVIEDPAIMVLTLAALTVLVVELLLRRRLEGEGHADEHSDLAAARP